MFQNKQDAAVVKLHALFSSQTRFSIEKSLTVSFSLRLKTLLTDGD